MEEEETNNNSSSEDSFMDVIIEDETNFDSNP